MLIVWAATILYISVCMTVPVTRDVYIRPEIFISFCTTMFIMLMKMQSTFKDHASPHQESKFSQESTCVGNNSHSKRGSRTSSSRKRESTAKHVLVFFDLLHRRLAVLKSSELESRERNAVHSQCLEAAEAMLFSLQDDLENPNSKARIQVNFGS